MFSVENGMLSSSGSVSHRPGLTERIVKYIANRAAKNISSEESQTMVPTAVMSGRLAGTCVRAVSTPAAVATEALLRSPGCLAPPTPRVSKNGCRRSLHP